MAKLIYFMPVSLDGYIADETGSPGWFVPDDEVFAFINDLVRPLGTYLYGRKMYQTMAVWETLGSNPDLPPGMRDFAQIWQAANKIVYSKSLKTVATTQTSLQTEFDPQEVRTLTDHSPHDISLSGPNLAAHAIHAGIVDEYHLLVVPMILGSGKRVLPDNTSVKLELIDERRFTNGMVYLRYRNRV